MSVLIKIINVLGNNKSVAFVNRTVCSMPTVCVASFHTVPWSYFVQLTEKQNIYQLQIIQYSSYIRPMAGRPRIAFPIARFMGPTWSPSRADRTQVGPMLAPWILLSRITCVVYVGTITVCTLVESHKMTVSEHWCACYINRNWVFQLARVEPNAIWILLMNHFLASFVYSATYCVAIFVYERNFADIEFHNLW